MDPVGLATRIIALIDTAIKIGDYIAKVKKGHKDREQLQDEVNAVYQVLMGIQDDLNRKDHESEEKWFRALERVIKKDGELHKLREVLERIANKLHLGPMKTTTKTFEVWTWPFTTKEVIELLAHMQRVKSNIQIALQRATLELNRVVDSNVQSLLKNLDATQRLGFADWISSLDFRELQQQPQRQPLAGTGDWFFQSAEFKGWAECRVPSLWCRGIPGAGKTLIASAAYDRLRDSHGRDNEAIHVLVAFCAFDDKRTHSAEAILSSLLRQTVELRSDMSDETQKLFDKYSSSDQTQRMNHDTVQKALSSQLTCVEKTFVILDGLDEMPDEKQRSDLLDTLEELDPHVQVIVFSRPLADIEEWFLGPAKKGRFRIPPPVRSRLCWSQELAVEDPTDTYDDDDYHSYDSEDDPGCDNCAFADVDIDRPVLVFPYQPSCYACQECLYIVCGKCYDACELCLGCGSGKHAFRYIRPQQIKVAAQPIDLEVYVRWRISQKPSLERQCDRITLAGQDLRQDIVDEVVSKARDMYVHLAGFESCADYRTRFLLAKFHMDSLVETPTPREMLASLGNLPNNIDRIFEQVYDRINTFAVAREVRQLIQLVAHARKPLTTKALEHAIAIKTTRGINEMDMVDAVDLVNKCQGLVVIDNRDNVRLSHETVGEYVRGEERSVGQQGGHAMMATICLNYLRNESVTQLYGVNEHPVSLAQQLPLLSYAASNWGYHVHLASDRTISTIVHGFFESSESVALAVQTMWYDDLESSNGWDATEDVSGLHLAAHFGLVEVVSSLLVKGEDVNTVDCLGNTALMYASEAGHGDVMASLLHATADASIRCSRGRTALHRACSNGRIQCVKQLVELEKDVLINATDPYRMHMTALHLAIYNGSEDILRLLLERDDLDVNRTTGDSTKKHPLSIAIMTRNIEILEILLNDPRIDVNVLQNFNNTPLILACKWDNVDAVYLLLKHGADPDKADLSGGGPLMRAIDYDSVASVRALIEHGVNYQTLDHHRRNVLHACSFYERSHILQYLLQIKPDLDLNAQGDRGETPLHDAIRNGYHRVVATLLESGARTDILDNTGRSPLRAAQEMGDDQLVAMLREGRKKELASGVPPPSQGDADARPGLNRAPTLEPGDKLPIHAAVRSLGAEEFALYLSDLGDIDIDEPDHDTQTPILTAIEHGKCDLLRLLISHGADVNRTDTCGLTPLHFAAVHSAEAVAILLARGVDTNAADRDGCTPLDLAVSGQARVGAYRESSGVAFQIVRAGGVAPKRGSRLPWLMRAAVEEGHLDIVRRLCALGVPCHLRLTADRLSPYQLAKRLGHEEIVGFLLGELRRSSRAKSGGAVGGVDGVGGDVLSVEDAGHAKTPGDDVVGGEGGEVELDEKAKEGSMSGVRDRFGNVVSLLGLTTRECVFLAIITALVSHILYTRL